MFSLFNRTVLTVHSAAFLLGAAGFLSRLLGLFRDRLLAAHFGAGRELDIYYAAFQIPDFMAVLFLLGAASAAIIPIFQEELARDPDAAKRLISRLTTLFLIAAGVLSGIIFLLAPFVMRIVAPGFDAVARADAAGLARIMLLSPIFLGLSGIFSSVTQSFRKFFAYACSPLFYNIGIIFGIVGFVPFMGIRGLAWGVVVGAGLHFLVQAYAIAPLHFFPRLVGANGDSGVGRVIRISFPRVISVSLSQLTLLAVTAIASTLAAGSVAVFNLAQNIALIPLGIFAVSYATALFPRLSQAWIDRRKDDFFNEFSLGVRSILFWIIPSAVLIVVLRAHIVRVALGAGAFSWDDTRLTAAVLAVLTIIMLAQSMASFFIKGFYALGDTWKPLWINSIFSAAAIVLAFFTAVFFGGNGYGAMAVKTVLRLQNLPHTEVVGLALGFSFGVALNAFFLYRSLANLARVSFGKQLPFPWRAVGKMIVSAFIAGAFAYGVRASFLEALPLTTFRGVLLQGAVAGCAGGIVYGISTFLLRSEEGIAFFNALQRRMLKIRTLPRWWNGDLPNH